jgi:hypothetical protein
VCGYWPSSDLKPVLAGDESPMGPVAMVLL